MPWYKLARPDGWDFYTGKTINYRAALGQVVTCPDYLARAVCGGGIHLSHAPNDCFHGGARIPCSAYLVEPVEGLVMIHANKYKAQSVRVITEIDDLDALFGWDYTGLLAFLATIPTVPWFTPDGAPEPTWRVFPARDAAWAAARDAARGAAWDAAWAAAGDAAGRAAWDAAWDAAWASAGDAAWAAAGDAAWAAAGMAQLCVCAGLPLAAHHADVLRARWRVWAKGYTLLGEVNGTLFVYEHI